MMGEISSIISGHITADKSTAGQTTDLAQEKKLKKACADFEAMLAFQLLKTMRQSVPKSGFLKSSQGQDTYEMMMDQKIAEEMAHKGEGLGLQKILYNEISQHYQKKIKVPDGK
jgi:peptidoglycan hydrolase FlgJ